jgi:hypothetical protein
MEEEKKEKENEKMKERAADSYCGYGQKSIKRILSHDSLNRHVSLCSALDAEI